MTPLEIRRVTRARAEARAAYDRLSRWYDLLSAGSEEPFVRAGLALLDLRPGERVLEIGCGTGRSLPRMAAAVGAAGSVCALDLSSGMLRASRRRLARASLPSPTALFCGDGALLPVTSGSFDAVFLSFTLELFDTPEIPRVLAECWRALRGGGRLAVVALAKSNPPGRMVRLYEWTHDHFPAWVDCRPIHAARAVAQAGFAPLRVELGSLAGLPVEIILAAKPAPPSSL